MDRTQALATLAVLVSLSGCASRDPQTIRVGSKNFTEQVVIGEIIAQHLEKRLSRPVDRRLNLGGTLLTHAALINGDIDVYPEYTGTAMAAILKQPVQSNDASAVLQRVRSAYTAKFGVEWLDPLGIDNGFAVVVRGPEARRHNLKTLSDAAKVPEQWALGAGYEFEQRSDGLAALDKTYGLRWKGPPKTMDLGLLYRALEQQQVSMIAANATDGLLSGMDVKVLADDKQAFPPYQICIAARRRSIETVPGLRDALQELSGKFTNDRMQRLNYEVDVVHRPVAEVAADFLKRSGL